jgi:hypothetical protein
MTYVDLSDASRRALRGHALRSALYAGDLLKLPATAASEAIVGATLELLHDELGPGDPRVTAEALAKDALFERVGRIRKRLFLEPVFHRLVRDVVDASGFDAAATAFDPVRLRVISHAGHENPRAAPVYYPHRDTWYAHPQGIVTFWIPLHDLGTEETFVFYPEWFARPVPNDSETFDYDAWIARGWSLKIGWQDIEAGRTARYPTVTGEFAPGRAVGFSCGRAESILFSGAHFHRTLPQMTGRCRFSLDFRAVHLGDHARALGAPNVDNRSRGSALRDYTMPSDER